MTRGRVGCGVAHKVALCGIPAESDSNRGRNARQRTGAISAPQQPPPGGNERVRVEGGQFGVGEVYVVPAAAEGLAEALQRKGWTLHA